MANIYDVGRLAGVSRSTVSRVLNGKGEVDPKTEERVWKAIKELHFYPNASARALVRHRTDMIGVILADITDPYYQKLIKGIESITTPLNIGVVYYNTYEDLESRRILTLSIINSGQVDGLIIIGSRKEDKNLITDLLQHSLPIAFIEQYFPDVRVICIISDNRQGPRLVVEYLLKLGHTRIACITGNLSFQTAHDRLESFKNAVYKYNLPISDEYIVVGNSDHNAGYAGMKKLLAVKPRPTAVFACNDMMAIGAILAARESGLSVPKDISVCGYDDIVFAPMLHPQLTTIRQPLFEMGAMAAQALINQISSGKTDDDSFKMILPVKLVIRKSCQAVLM